jgi:type I restriction enzyme S subunit
MDKVSLVKIANINMGQSPLSESYNKVGDGLPFFQGKTDFGDVYPKVRIFCTSPNKIAEADDILISVRAPVGSINICKTKSCIGRGLAAIRAKSEIEQKYLYHFLNFYEPQLAQIGKGSTFEAVNREDVENIEVPLPKPNEQKRIAAILDKADRLRRQRRFAQTLSDSFLQSVFIKMFGDPVSNPMNWNVKPFGDVVINKDSQRQPVKSLERAERKGIYPYYGASGIIDYVDNFLFDEKTLLISEDGMNLINRSTPIAFIAEGKYWVNNHAHVVSDNGQVDLEFLRVLLNHTNLDDFITGIDQMKLTQENMNKIPIPVPPRKLQNKFAEIVQKYERVRRQQREATRQAEHLFQTLLHRAFRGEL